MHEHSHYRAPKRREKRSEKIFEEITAENFLNMGKEMVSTKSKKCKVPGIIKLTKRQKNKDKILKTTRGKWQITYKGSPIRLSAVFSTETPEVRREWHDVFKVMKEKNLKPRIFYSARFSFRFDREIKRVTD